MNPTRQSRNWESRKQESHPEPDNHPMNALLLLSVMLLGPLAVAQQADAPAPAGPPLATGVLPPEGGLQIIRGALRPPM